MSDYSIEDLLEILGERVPEKEPSPVFEGKLGEYISVHNICQGVDRIPNYVIYYNYKQQYKGELSKIEFFRQFNLLFGEVRIRTGKQRGYRLDGSSFNLTREGILEAKYYDEKEKKERQGRISRSKRKDKSKN